MLTQDQIITAVAQGRESEAMDGRDYSRLVDFMPLNEWSVFGCDWPHKDVQPVQIELTEENVKKQLARDLDFAFEKALNQRGISASCMYAVIKMWMWVLEDDLQHCVEYAQYGLPLLKKVAVKYDLPNPIGLDYGNEQKYSCD
jgi:hypothetical protein